MIRLAQKTDEAVCTDECTKGLSYKLSWQLLECEFGSCAACEHFYFIILRFSHVVSHQRGSSTTEQLSSHTAVAIYMLWIRLCMTVYDSSHDNRYITDDDKCCKTAQFHLWSGRPWLISVFRLRSRRQINYSNYIIFRQLVGVLPCQIC